MVNDCKLFDNEAKACLIEYFLKNAKAQTLSAAIEIYVLTKDSISCYYKGFPSQNNEAIYPGTIISSSICAISSKANFDLENELSHALSSSISRIPTGTVQVLKKSVRPSHVVPPTNVSTRNQASKDMAGEIKNKQKSIGQQKIQSNFFTQQPVKEKPVKKEAVIEKMEDTPEEPEKNKMEDQEHKEEPVPEKQDNVQEEIKEESEPEPKSDSKHESVSEPEQEVKPKKKQAAKRKRNKAIEKDMEHIKQKTKKFQIKYSPKKEEEQSSEKQSDKEPEKIETREEQFVKTINKTRTFMDEKGYLQSEDYTEKVTETRTVKVRKEAEIEEPILSKKARKKNVGQSSIMQFLKK